jgi:hypothetical protein
MNDSFVAILGNCRQKNRKIVLLFYCLVHHALVFPVHSSASRIELFPKLGYDLSSARVYKNQRLPRLVATQSWQLL